MARIKITYPETTHFSHELTVRVSDLNIGNHLAHDKLISLLHEARAHFFEAYQMSELDVEGAGIIMADLGVNYRSEAFFGQQLRIDIALGDFSSKEFQAQSDGALFYKRYIGRDDMPNFEKKMSEEDMWLTVHFIRTLKK